MVLPVLSWREQLVELCGSMALAPLFALVATLIWAAVGQTRQLHDLGNIFFLTIAASWAVLVPGKLWAARRGDSWGRRIVMLVLGAAIGVGALWLDGWTPESVAAGLRQADWTGLMPRGPVLADAAESVCYFALAFFALRWWKLTDRRRSYRFSFAPILAAGFWTILLLLIWPRLWEGAVAMVMAAVIVQLVSPWEEPLPKVSRRMRLRYA
jgi:hypothetical protein